MGAYLAGVMVLVGILFWLYPALDRIADALERAHPEDED